MQPRESRIAKALPLLGVQGAKPPGLVVSSISLLSGGAIQQNWRVDVVVDGAPQSWVLRTDAAATLAVSRSRAEEYFLLRAAFAAGAPVPEPLHLCTDNSVIGAPFFVMRRAEGMAAAHRIVRSDTIGGGREALLSQLGIALARIHAVRFPHADLAFLPAPADPCPRFIADMRARLDAAATPRPMLEWGLRHLERAAFPAGEIVLCHNDFRTGNYLATPAELTAVLDWEFAAWGDPHEDIGWFCAKCWRFGSPHEAGGVGPRATFYAAYEAASGRRIDPARVAWWERAATIRWAVIAAEQAQRHISGREPSLELALTGHIVPELELEVMRATLSPK